MVLELHNPAARIVAIVMAGICCACSLTTRLFESPTPSPTVKSSDARSAAKQAAQLVQTGSFEQAKNRWGEAYRLALRDQDTNFAINALISQANCQFLLYSYRDALRIYLEALRLAKDNKNLTMQGVVSANLASLHLSLGEAEKAQTILAELPQDGSSVPDLDRLEFLLLNGNVHSELKNYKLADASYQRALKEAETVPEKWRASSPEVNLKEWGEAPKELRRAWVFEVIGQSLMDRGQDQQAEIYLLEAFRIRFTFRDPSRFREATTLGVLMGRRGNYEGAQNLLGIARRHAKTGRSLNQLLISHREEAKLLLSQGKASEALSHLRAALNYSRAWRLEALPSDSAYLRFESQLNTEVHQLFLDAIGSEAGQAQSPKLAAEAFWVAEESRFASVRAAQFPASDFHDRLPSAFWEGLSRLQSLRAASLSLDRSPNAEIKSLEASLNRMELEAGLAIPHAGSISGMAFRDWQKTIPPDELIFTFHVGDRYSLSWTIDAKSIHLRYLPGRRQLRKLIQDFRRETLNSSQDRTSSTGSVLSRHLFGDFLSSHRTIPFWTMVLDDELNSLPLAAMPAGGADPAYLVEEHAIRVLPSAIHMGSIAKAKWSHRAVAFSDPVYNSADKRTDSTKVLPIRQARFETGLQLSRLPFTAQEAGESLAVCRKAGFETETFLGTNASLSNLRTAIAGSPDILHLATHIVSDSRDSGQSFLAFSQAQLFGPLDLNANRSSTRVVVLSGCNSSAGEVISGIGIAGLSRAWLISGASSVVATLWPTKDVPGPFFPAFYEALVSEAWSSRAAAVALQRAQQRMIKRKDWYSQPAYWAAYIPLSRG